ncbi:TRAP transporter small permease [Robertmurraya sp. DFI.2.37]|uniref:TRAP transporter small permease n=1 Tax=Robertmurraya sp. DFI.2.37 TaxID=3031819 RepID=UPI00177E2FE8|nr:TRAP transporter small permease [Robertmurraya sp. DFI.2.37]MDF1506776.1 TRAP transporter small permease [Robertmurraya sp. DFI.2.37]
MKKLNSFLEGLCGAFLLVMTVIALSQVVTRYVLEMSFPWLEEVIRYLMVFTVYVGSAVAVKQKAHLNVEIFDQLLKKSSFRYVDLLRQFVIVVFGVVFGYVSFQVVIQLIASGQITPALQISMAWPMSALFLGSLLMIINGIYLFYMIFKSKEAVKEGGTL